MKKTLRLAAAALAALSTATAAYAADWKPSGPIKLIISFAAGGGADTQARMIAEEIEAKHGWKFLPQQVTGKGGLNAVKALMKEPGDGTSIALIVSESLGYAMAASKAGVPTDVTPITTTAGTQLAIVAPTTKGWTNVNFNIISVKGGKAVMNGLAAGDMDIGFGAGIQAKAVAAGDMVELASIIGKPLNNSPDAPLLSEYGVDFTYKTTFLFAGPKDMDPAARDAIASAISKVVMSEGGKANTFITRGFGGPVIIQGADLEARVQGEFDEAGALMSAASE